MFEVVKNGRGFGRYLTRKAADMDAEEVGGTVCEKERGRGSSAAVASLGRARASCESASSKLSQAGLGQLVSQMGDVVQGIDAISADVRRGVRTNRSLDKADYFKPEGGRRITDEAEETDEMMGDLQRRGDKLPLVLEAIEACDSAFRSLGVAKDNVYNVVHEPGANINNTGDYTLVGDVDKLMDDVQMIRIQAKRYLTAGYRTREEIEGVTPRQHKPLGWV